MTLHGRQNDRTVELLLNDHLETMLISAVRYATGRRTYIVNTTVNYMIPKLPALSDWCLSILSRDMYDAFAMYERTDGRIGLGDPCDAKDWTRFRKAVRSEISSRPDFDASRHQQL